MGDIHPILLSPDPLLWIILFTPVEIFDTCGREGFEELGHFSLPLAIPHNGEPLDVIDMFNGEFGFLPFFIWRFLQHMISRVFSNHHVMHWQGVFE